MLNEDETQIVVKLTKEHCELKEQNDLTHYESYLYLQINQSQWIQLPRDQKVKPI